MIVPFILLSYLQLSSAIPYDHSTQEPIHPSKVTSNSTQTHNNQTFTALIVFGDSFSDAGNGSRILSGGSWPPDFYFQGRFSNGPIWADHLATELNLTSSYYNYAIGGATTSSKLVKGYTGPHGNISVPGVQQQVDRFIATQKNGTGPKIDYSTTLFGLDGGANDFFFNPNITVNETISTLRSIVHQLRGIGMQSENLILFSYYDFSQAPFASFSTPAYKEISREYSIEFSKALEKLSQEETGSIFINNVEKFSHYYYYGEPQEFGFDQFGAYGSCAVGKYKEYGSNNITVCDESQADKKVFWDEYHPSTRAHKELSQAVIEQMGMRS